MSGRGQVAAQLAMPGDPDLDADVDGITITSVITVDETREILILGGDAHGRFLDANSGEMVDLLPGDPVARIHTVELSARLPGMPDQPWVDYVATLHRWRDQATPLRMCSVPGRVTLLIEDRDTFLPFPRRPDPAAGELR